MVNVRKTYKYRIYPTKAQKTALNEQFELCRWVFNETLALKKELWEKHKIGLSLYDLNKKLTEWKRTKPELKKVYAQVLQKVQERVDLAFKAFFRRCKAGENPGYPRFKNTNQLKSICFKQGGWKFDEITAKLTLSKIGDVKVNYHRPFQGNVKTVTVIRHLTGKFYVCFSVEVNGNGLLKTNKTVGIDLGCKTLATFSDGNKIDNPRFFKQQEKELNKYKNKRDKAKKAEDWTAHKKHTKVVRHIYERVTNKRENLAFQTANQLVNKYDTIIFEDLTIDKMNSFKGRNKSIRDAAWSNLVQKTQFKAEWAGKKVILVDPAYTSKTCSRCEVIHYDFDNSKERMVCQCGNNMQRDENASLNILRRGLASLSGLSSA